ncbi:unnamed protein product [Amoebophrya sp. A25]|nr:unnamed protein product [Amoebophrya sp. A25]|eukprot:GSA25T00010275001.1
MSDPSSSRGGGGSSSSDSSSVWTAGAGGGSDFSRPPLDDSPTYSHRDGDYDRYHGTGGGGGSSSSTSPAHGTRAGGGGPDSRPPGGQPRSAPFGLGLTEMPTRERVMKIEQQRKLLLQEGTYEDAQGRYLRLYHRPSANSNTNTPAPPPPVMIGGQGGDPRQDSIAQYEQQRNLRALFAVESARLPPLLEDNPIACVTGGIVPSLMIGLGASVFTPPHPRRAIQGAARFYNYAGCWYAYSLLQCPYRLLRANDVLRVDSMIDHMVAGGTVGALAVQNNRLSIPVMKEVDVKLLLQRYPKLSRGQVAFFVYGHCAAFAHAISLFLSGTFRH